MEYVVLILLAIIVYQWLKQSKDSRNSNTQISHGLTDRPTSKTTSKSIESAAPSKYPSARRNATPTPEITPALTATSQPISRGRGIFSANPTFNTGIEELDGPGMYQRLTSQGPQGHCCYLLYSPEHRAYKVGIIRPDQLGDRIKMIRQQVPDVFLAGTRVFTSRQNAFDAEQAVLSRYRDNRYTGIIGRNSGRTEWITVRPARPDHFMSPKKVEDRFRRDSEAPIQDLEIPDNFTVYLVYSDQKQGHLVKCCASRNINRKIREIRDNEAPDAQLISRFKIESLARARAIAIDINTGVGSYERIGRVDVYHWTGSASVLRHFDNWDRDGNRIRSSSSP